MAKYSAETLQELGEMLLEITHGEDRETIIDAIQKKRPDFKAPDVEIKRLKKDMDSRFEEQKQERDRQEMLTRLESQKRNLVDSGRYTDDDVGKIENLMQEKGIGSYEDGAILYGATTKPARPVSEIRSSSWEMPNFKGLMENPNKWARDEANNAMAEIAQNRNRR